MPQLLYGDTVGVPEWAVPWVNWLVPRSRIFQLTPSLVGATTCSPWFPLLCAPSGSLFYRQLITEPSCTTLLIMDITESLKSCFKEELAPGTSTPNPPNVPRPRISGAGNPLHELVNTARQSLASEPQQLFYNLHPFLEGRPHCFHHGGGGRM